jgi:hypothetical protein
MFFANKQPGIPDSPGNLGGRCNDRLQKLSFPPVKCWKSKYQLLVSRTIHLVLVCVILADHSCHGSPSNSGVECPLNVVLTMMANPSARENGSLEGWHEVGGGNEMLDTCGYLDTWIPMIASF